MQFQNTPLLWIVIFIVAMVLFLTIPFMFRKKKPPKPIIERAREIPPSPVPPNPLRNRVTEDLKRRFDSFCVRLDEMLREDTTGSQGSVTAFTKNVLLQANLEILHYNSAVRNKERLDEYVPGYHLLILDRAFNVLKLRFGTLGTHAVIEQLMGFCVDRFELKVLWSGFMRNHNRIPYSVKANAMGEYLLDFFTSEELKQYYDFSGSLDHWDPGYIGGPLQISRPDFYKLFKLFVLDDRYFPEMRSLMSKYGDRDDSRTRQVAQNQRQRAKRVRRQVNRRR